MRWAWISGVFPMLAWAAEPTLAPPTEAPPAEPQSFAVSHYELLQGYSPFVKSLEAAKETEKSPDLVVVGYGRMKGEDHVIIQQKENSEKREKIGSRYGSKDFPYRLLSVTNTSDRKSMIAVLEDQNKRKLQVRYAAESALPLPGGTAVGAGASQTGLPATGNPPRAGEDLGAKLEKKSPLFALQNQSVEDLQDEVKKLEEAINNPKQSDAGRQDLMKLLEGKKIKLQALQNPVDLAPAEAIDPKASP